LNFSGWNASDDSSWVTGETCSFRAFTAEPKNHAHQEFINRTDSFFPNTPHPPRMHARGGVGIFLSPFAVSLHPPESVKRLISVGNPYTVET